MLDLKLLGAPQIMLHGAPFTLRRNSIKARALLFYLAAVGAPETRERLAGLFWADWPEQKARAYLRGELHLLSDLKEEYLLDADGRLSLNLAHCRIDVRNLQHAASTPAPSLEELLAASQYAGAVFLDGLGAQLEGSAPLFVEWLYTQREIVERQIGQVLYRLANLCAEEGRMLTAGIDACTHLLDQAPEREEVHRLKMQLLARDGQRGAALKQYDACASALMDELGVPLSAETNTLYDRILAGDFDRATRSAAPVDGDAPRRAPFQAIAPPAQLVGRDAEIAQLLSLIHI